MITRRSFIAKSSLAVAAASISPQAFSKISEQQTQPEQPVQPLPPILVRYARPIDKSGQPGFPTALRREHAFELMHLKGHRTEVCIIPDQRNVNVFIDHDMIHHDVTVPTDIPRLA